MSDVTTGKKSLILLGQHPPLHCAVGVHSHVIDFDSDNGLGIDRERLGNFAWNYYGRTDNSWEVCQLIVKYMIQYESKLLKDDPEGFAIKLAEMLCKPAEEKVLNAVKR